MIYRLSIGNAKETRLWRYNAHTLNELLTRIKAHSEHRDMVHIEFFNDAGGKVGHSVSHYNSNHGPEVALLDNFAAEGHCLDLNFLLDKLAQAQKA